MITALGLATDPTMRHFLHTAPAFGADVRLVDLSELVAGRWELRLPPEDDRSWVEGAADGPYTLDPSGRYYCRLIDLSAVMPEEAVEWHALTSGISGWLEMAPGRVVNRPGHAEDNACKPLHETVLASLGLNVPESLTTSKRDELEAFARGGPAVAKALSGQRADCRVVTEADFGQYEEDEGPVHIQRLVPGDDMRAHVVGDRVIAVRMRSDSDDYRLDPKVSFEPYELPPGIAERLRHATRELGLAFAGWDLRLDGSRYWTFEANPMPGYHYYDTELDGRITAALVEYLQTGGAHDQ